MPSHPDRVAKSYDGLCTRCLKYPNRDWDDEAAKPDWCEGCMWRYYYTDSLNNPNIQKILERYPE